MTLQHSEITLIFKAIIAAGSRIRDKFRSPNAVTIKPDGSPVTDVDQIVNSLLLRFAKAIDIGYIAEEGNGSIEGDYILYVDPLDGTSSFINGIPTVAVAASIMKRVTGLHYRPIASIIYEPITGWAWCNYGTDTSYQCINHNLDECVVAKVGTAPHPARVTTIFPPGPLRPLSRIRRRIADVEHITEKTCRSTALCGGLIASGAQHGLAFGGESATEVCAMLPILEGAGAIMSDLSGQPLDTFELGEHKGKVDFLLPNGFLAACDTELWRDLFTLVEETYAAA